MISESEFLNLLKNYSGKGLLNDNPNNILIYSEVTEPPTLVFSTVDYNFLQYLHSLNANFNVTSTLRIYIKTITPAKLRTFISDAAAIFYGKIPQYKTIPNYPSQLVYKPW